MLVRIDSVKLMERKSSCVVDRRYRRAYRLYHRGAPMKRLSTSTRLHLHNCRS